MPALKEIKERLGAVKSTRQITSAMEMVSSSKLRKAQNAISGMLPYRDKLSAIMTDLLQADNKVNSPYEAERDLAHVALIVFSSNTSLCGKFNQNVCKLFDKVYSEYADKIGKDNVIVYPVGKKIETYVTRKGVKTAGSFQKLVDTPTRDDAAAMAADLMKKFKEGSFDRVELLYHHFKSKGVQELVDASFLPYNLAGLVGQKASSDLVSASDPDSFMSTKYIVEPGVQGLVDEILPKFICQQFYTVVMDSVASEHAARTVAMQTATDNADDLVRELTKEYNKLRQQSITNELLDIVRGSMK